MNVLCFGDHDKPEPTRAEWLLPQSRDSEIVWVPACEGHRVGWWDGADWDGKDMEIDLAKLEES